MDCASRAERRRRFRWAGASDCFGKVYPKSPAANAGLSPGLLIQKIEGTSTAGKTILECQTLLRADGRPNVHLEIVDPQKSETNVIELTRGKFITAG